MLTSVRGSRTAGHEEIFLGLMRKRHTWAGGAALAEKAGLCLAGSEWLTRDCGVRGAQTFSSSKPRKISSCPAPLLRVTRDLLCGFSPLLTLGREVFPRIFIGACCLKTSAFADFKTGVNHIRVSIAKPKTALAAKGASPRPSMTFSHQAPIKIRGNTSRKADPAHGLS
jgi:hypothetical protein